MQTLVALKTTHVPASLTCVLPHSVWRLGFQQLQISNTIVNLYTYIPYFCNTHDQHMERKTHSPPATIFRAIKISCADRLSSFIHKTQEIPLHKLNNYCLNLYTVWATRFRMFPLWRFSLVFLFVGSSICNHVFKCVFIFQHDVPFKKISFSRQIHGLAIGIAWILKDEWISLPILSKKFKRC